MPPREEEPLADGMMNHSGVNAPISCVRIIIPPSIIYNCLATGGQSLIQTWITARKGCQFFTYTEIYRQTTTHIPNHWRHFRVAI